ncbi:MAG: hypothetical protein IH571_00090 [Acholeplasmataceae bacterium]|nr:hypothetical protein [Acholeplasmataceae bacterium]
MNMSESVLEIKIKNYHLKADNESMIIFKGDEVLLKANFKEIKAAGQWLISKVRELKNENEIKKIESKE